MLVYTWKPKRNKDFKYLTYILQSIVYDFDSLKKIFL